MVHESDMKKGAFRTFNFIREKFMKYTGFK